MTPMFPGWHLPTLRRKPKTDIQKLIDTKNEVHSMSLSRLSQYLSRYIPGASFNRDKSTSFSRRRVFSVENTFWGFFQQILSVDGGCQEIVIQGSESLILESLILNSAPSVFKTSAFWIFTTQKRFTSTARYALVVVRFKRDQFLPWFRHHSRYKNAS